MSESYIIGIDQSTQGTKALLFNKNAELLFREDIPHRQIINEAGWVSHDPEEIYDNTVKVVKRLLENHKISSKDVCAIGISNQRETSVLWDRLTGKAMNQAIVWQCARAADICNREVLQEKRDYIFKHTGIPLSPYFPAAKIAWLLENTEDAREKAKNHTVCHGTVDSWLVYRLTNGKSYKTDYSNASRTQLFDIIDLKWNEEICRLFGIDVANLPEITDSDGYFGETTLEGYFEKPVPIHAVLGDSHAALYGQECHREGMVKATYGTGSSIMMNVGEKPVLSTHGLVSSLAWRKSGKAEFVLEGNLNYTGAVITWLKDDMKMIESPGETEVLAEAAIKNDTLYLVPAFSGLGAPYWNSAARASAVGMSRTTGRNEFVRAGVECIAYQISDIISAMEEDSGIKVEELRVDGGPTRNSYLMQFQSDILDAAVYIPAAEELSGIGTAYMAGIAAGLWNQDIFKSLKRKAFLPAMEKSDREKKISGWKDAVRKVVM